MVIRFGPIALTSFALCGSTGCSERPRTYNTVPVERRPLLSDNFDRVGLGPKWYSTGAHYHIDDGALTVDGPRNQPLWLRAPLPDDVHIEFDAWSDSTDGDIKFEIAGDGESYAQTTSYKSSSYVLIFGGWQNTRNVIARRDEHGSDRRTATHPKVEPKRRYHFAIDRLGGSLTWHIDGREILRYDDRAPLTGPQHRHFAFSGWDAVTHFDNLTIDELAGPGDLAADPDPDERPET
ncbi:MAG: hypothetical protein V3V08_16300 [Nannocystaceae bacterium]